MTVDGVRGLHHIGYWVDDLDTAMTAASDLLGVGPFQVLRHVDLGDFAFHPAAGGVDRSAVLDHTAAFTQWGPVLLELNAVHAVQPQELRDSLGIRHGAVSHVAWTTDDLVTETTRMQAQGCALLTTSVGGAVANWLSGGQLFGHPIEVHQPPAGVREFWDQITRSSAT